MTKLSGTQERYIQGLAGKADVLSFAQLNRLAELCGGQSAWTSADSSVASKMIATLQKARDDAKYRVWLQTKLG